MNFKPLGVNECNNPIFGSVMSSNPINIVGAPDVLPNYGISSSITQALGCGAGPWTAEYTFKLVNQGVFASGDNDGWRITLPAGWAMNTETIDFVNNPTGAALLEVDGGDYDFAIGEGLAIGDSIVFKAMLYSTSLDPLQCSTTDPIIENAFVQFTANCVEPELTCAIKQLLSGENASTTIEVVKPEYSMQVNIDEEATKNSNRLIGSVQMNLEGDVYVAQEVTINPYNDVNLNGVIDDADEFIGSTSSVLVDNVTQVIPFDIPTAYSDQVVFPSIIAIAEMDCACAAPMDMVTNITLPVDFVNVEARADGCDVRVQFATGYEDNIRCFALMHSMDGRVWDEIATIESRVAEGNSVQNREYIYVHTPAIGGQNYYMANAIDVNGKITSSKVVQAVVYCGYQEPILYPNPASGWVYISGIEQGEFLDVYDQLGKRWHLSWTYVQDGVIGLDVSSLSEGNYHIRVVDRQGNDHRFKMTVLRQ